MHYRDVQDKYGELTTPSVLANCMLWVERVRSDFPLLLSPLVLVSLFANLPALAQGVPASDTGAMPAREHTLRVACSCLLLVAVAVCAFSPYVGHMLDWYLKRAQRAACAHCAGVRAPPQAADAAAVVNGRPGGFAALGRRLDMHHSASMVSETPHALTDDVSAGLHLH